VTLGWLLIRLCAAQDAGYTAIDIDRLFGFRRDFVSTLEVFRPGDVAVSFYRNPRIKYHEIGVKKGIQKFEINVSKKQFIDIARSFHEHMSFISMEEWQVLKPVGEKNPDLILVFQNAATQKPFVIFLDCKSQRISTKRGNSSRNPYKLSMKQYNYTVNLKQGLIDLSSKENVQLDPISQAVADGDFLFIYMCTHKEVEYYADKEKKIRLPLLPPQVMCMKAEECKNFFGCMFSLYEVACKMNE
jgi:hypothetical protein